MSNSDSSIPSGFRQIPGFPRYAISEDGTVLSICPRNGRGAAKPWSEAHRIVPVIASNGYHRISLCRERRTQQVQIHVLVLTSFSGPCPNEMECRHLDGDRSNNHITNLAWGTHSENMLDKILHGTNPIIKLNAGDVLEIRRRAANGELHRILAVEFHVLRSSISVIVNRHSWKHI